MSQKTASQISQTIVNENGEKMVSLNGVREDKIVAFSKAYREGKNGSIKEVLVREKVKDLLIEVAESLPEGYKLVVWETYTPRALQEYLKGKVLDDISGLSHMTGGAVDVSLADSNGNLLNMGTDLNHGSPENKSTFYFEELKELSEEEKEIRKNRRILYNAMNNAGFTNAPSAWFHWDYGNQSWATINGEEGFYSSIDI